MKQLSPAFQAHLDSATTTLAWCWKLARRDGVTFGFTDHDRNIAFDGTIFESAAGFTASEIRDTLGLAVDNLEVSAALSSARLDESDLAAGLYDEAGVEIWRVNWDDPTQRALMRRGSLGEVRRQGQAFSAEVRGLAHYLNQTQGRLYQYTCDATLGDARCGVPLLGAPWSMPAIVTAVASPRRISVSGLASAANDWFSRGIARFSQHLPAAVSVEVRRHQRDGAIAHLDLWQPLAHDPVIGEALLLSAGCNKHFKTCCEKFNNGVNFRGFPHMPGNQLLSFPARQGDANDGGTLR